MTIENTDLTIARQEYGYAGMGGVGLTAYGKLVIEENFDNLRVGPDTRRIQNPLVEDALSAPIKIYYDPTYICNLSCPWCLAGVPTRRVTRSSVPSLSPSEVENINTQIIDSGTLQVKIGGGEPFIYSPFWRSVEQLGDANIGLSTSTSGVTLANKDLLNTNQIGLLAKYKVKVSLSVDGEPDFHNSARGKEGLLQAALTVGIPRLRDGGIGLNKIEYRATITSDTNSMRQVDYLSRLAEETQTLIRIRFARPYGSAADNGNGIVGLTPEVRKLMLELRQLSTDNPFVNIDGFLNFDKTPGVKTGLDCGAGTREAHIDPKGRFYPCGPLEPFMKKAHSLLDGDLTLLEYWQVGEAFLDIRGFYKKENLDSPCAECAFVDACQGGCASVRLSQGLSVNPLCPKNI